LLVGHIVRDRHEQPGSNISNLRVGIRRFAGIDNPVSHCDVSYARPHGLDDAGGFAAQTGRQVRRIEPRTMISIDEIQGIDEIQADSGMADLRLALPWVRDVDFLPPENVRSSEFINTYRVSFHSRQSPDLDY
jgi:hypothetical protein